MGGTSSLTQRPTSASVRSLSSLTPQDIRRGESFIDQHPWIRHFMPLFATVCLFAILFGYAFLGAAIFEALEKGHEAAQIKTLQKDRKEFREWIMNIAESARNDTDYNMHKNLTWIDEKVEKYEVELRTKVCEEKLDLKGDPKWTFYGSLFLASTVITTIGYGNIAPVTVPGRIFCMAYAIFGISLLLLVLASIGSLLARGATLTYRMLHGKIGTLTIGKRKKNTEQEERAESYQRQNGAATSGQDQHREKVIDDIWGTIRFDKNGKMIVPDDSETKSQPSSPESENAKSPKDFRVDFAEANHKSKRNAVGIDDDKSSPRQREDASPGPSGEEEIEKSLGFGVMDESDGEQEVNIPLHVVLVLAGIYIVLLAGTLKIWESQWDFFDALYFSFVTLTTIGFGDLVPHHQKNLLGCTFLIILGMAIISMCIALAQEFIMRKIAWLSQKIGVALVRSSSGKETQQNNESSYA